jgi:uncharacterized protein (DUF2147 family)
MKSLLCFILVVTAIAPAHAAAPVTGKWMTTEKDSIVEVGPCGAALCGKIIRILKPNPKGPTVDANNPNPALRNRPIQGLMILSGFGDNGKNWAGTVYDPRRGKSFTSYLARLADGTLQVQGCITSFLCKTMIWTPAGLVHGQ